MVSFAMLVHFVGGLFLFGESCVVLAKCWSEGYVIRVPMILMLVVSVALIWMGIDIYAGKLDPNNVQWIIPR